MVARLSLFALISRVRARADPATSVSRATRDRTDPLAPLAAAIVGNKATANQPPLRKPFYKESDSNERLRVSNWIVQKLYDYAVKETVEL